MNTPQLTSGWVRKFSMLGGRNECRAWSRHTTARCLYLYMKSSYKEPGSGSGLWLFIPFTWPSSKCSPQEGLDHIFDSVVSPLFYPHQTYSPHHILWQKFKEKFYNGSLCFDSGSNWEGPQDWKWSLSWLCQMKQTPQSLDWFRLESLAVSSKSLKLRIGCIIVKKW